MFTTWRGKIAYDSTDSFLISSSCSIQDSLKTSVCETIKEHIAKGFRVQEDVIQNSVITAVRSRAVTPAPHIVDSQVQQLQIEQLIGQGQINAAFQQVTHITVHCAQYILIVPFFLTFLFNFSNYTLMQNANHEWWKGRS